ncbi:MAG: twin-arginine translocase TatA/TatE family subunit [Armatimonadota bacterium]|nr:twin-arginine translocase TatA/TatE family subunit [Armatimonadota bacterium]MDW8289758.1 twin-arginine translocase TatA/TatE family subunit [Armatimonadota bacterium]
MFGSLGFGEVMMILIIGLIIFGPKKLPEIGRSLGNAIREFRRASNDIVNTLSLDNDYSTSSRRSYSDYSGSYSSHSSYAEPSSYPEQTVSQSDLPADDINVASSPEEPYDIPSEQTSVGDNGEAAPSRKVRPRQRRVLTAYRASGAHRNTRRRV